MLPECAAFLRLCGLLLFRSLHSGQTVNSCKKAAPDSARLGRCEALLSWKGALLRPPPHERATACPATEKQVLLAIKILVPATRPARPVSSSAFETHSRPAMLVHNSIFDGFSLPDRVFTGMWLSMRTECKCKAVTADSHFAFSSQSGVVCLNVPPQLVKLVC